MYLITCNSTNFWPRNLGFSLISRSIIANNSESELKKIYDIKKIIESPFNNELKTAAAYKLAWNLSEELVDFLGDKLNAEHKIQETRGYWNTHLKIWCLLHATIMVDRYERSKNAIRELGKFKYYSIQVDTLKVPIDISDYYAKMGLSDDHNCYIYAKIFELLGYEVHHEFKVGEKKSSDINAVKKKKKYYIKKIIISVYKKLLVLISKRVEVILVTPYLPKIVELKIMLYTFFKIVPYKVNSKYEDIYKVDEKKRGRESSLFQYYGDNELLKISIEVLDKTLPKCFLEQFIHNRKKSEDVYPKLAISAIFSANSWWFDEYFKHWVAELKIKKGTIFIGGKHGGSALVRKYCNWEMAEQQITDYYLSWGRADFNNKKIVSTPANILIDIKKRNKISGKRILYGSTSQTRYSTLFISDFNKYLTDQRKFFKIISEKLSKELYVRLHPSDYGWNIKNGITSVNQNVKYDDISIPFRESIANCRVYVCDHYHTTYIEALSLNIPTILFWDMEEYPVLKYVEPFVNDLIEANVLHTTPEDAAKWLNEVYTDPSTWWLSDKTQRSVTNFLEYFGSRSNKPTCDWVEILLNLKREFKET